MVRGCIDVICGDENLLTNDGLERVVLLRLGQTWNSTVLYQVSMIVYPVMTFNLVTVSICTFFKIQSFPVARYFSPG